MMTQYAPLDQDAWEEYGGAPMSEELNRKLYWAWFDNKTGAYCYVYDRRFLVEMCSPDGFKEAEARGEGRIVRVNIEEAKE